MTDIVYRIWQRDRKMWDINTASYMPVPPGWFGSWRSRAGGDTGTYESIKAAKRSAGQLDVKDYEIWKFCMYKDGPMNPDYQLPEKVFET